MIDLNKDIRFIERKDEFDNLVMMAQVKIGAEFTASRLIINTENPAEVKEELRRRLKILVWEEIYGDIFREIQNKVINAQNKFRSDPYEFFSSVNNIIGEVYRRTLPK